MGGGGEEGKEAEKDKNTQQHLGQLTAGAEVMDDCFVSASSCRRCGSSSPCKPMIPVEDCLEDSGVRGPSEWPRISRCRRFCKDSACSLRFSSLRSCWKIKIGASKKMLL